MDAHLSRVVRAMGGMISLYSFIYQIYASENVALCNTKFPVSSSFFFLFIHPATQQLAAGVNRRLVTNRKVCGAKGVSAVSPGNRAWLSPLVLQSTQVAS